MAQKRLPPFFFLICFFLFNFKLISSILFLKKLFSLTILKKN